MTTASERRRWWWELHAWVGLKLSLLLGFILFTGTCAVLSHELDWLLREPMRASSAVPTDEVAWGAAFESARRARPHATLNSLTWGPSPEFAVQATFSTPWREFGRMWFDPVDGRYRGETPWLDLRRFFRMIHRHLMIPPKVGVPLVSALALPLAFSLVSGLVVQRRLWRGLWRRPRMGRGLRIGAGDLHRWVGLWSSWFVALMVVTSAWYLAESLGVRAPAFPASSPPAPRADALPADLDAGRLDAAIAAARETLPGLRVSFVGLPNEPGKPIAVQGQLSASLVRRRANTVHVDPVTGAVLGHHRGESLGVHRRIAEAADPLHFGTFGGLWSKSLWFLFGLGLSALSFSGVLIYAERIRAERRRSPVDDPPRTRWAIWWRGLGALRWPSALLIAIGLGIWIVYEPVPLDWTEHGERPIGDGTARLATRGSASAGSPLRVRLEVAEAGNLRLAASGGPPVALRGFDGDDGRLEGEIRIPPETRILTLRLAGDGEPVAEWRLGRLIGATTETNELQR